MNVGKIKQIIGPTLDVEFHSDHLPQILNEIRVEDTKRGLRVVAEVAQHIGNNTVRCVSMNSTDGLVRGMDAEDMGRPIAVPVGPQVLGHIFNLVGDTLEGRGALPEPDKCRWSTNCARN